MDNDTGTWASDLHHRALYPIPSIDCWSLEFHPQSRFDPILQYLCSVLLHIEPGHSVPFRLTILLWRKHLRSLDCLVYVSCWPFVGSLDYSWGDPPNIPPYFCPVLFLLVPLTNSQMCQGVLVCNQQLSAHPYIGLTVLRAHHLLVWLPVPWLVFSRPPRTATVESFLYFHEHWVWVPVPLVW